MNGAGPVQSVSFTLIKGTTFPTPEILWLSVVYTGRMSPGAAAGAVSLCTSLQVAVALNITLMNQILQLLFTPTDLDSKEVNNYSLYDIL